MNKEILKSALFGYSKISVCQYIATMNEEFNAKLMAETAAFREERAKLQKRIDELEAELAAHRQSACEAGALLLKAEQYAEQRRLLAQAEAAQLLQQAQEEAEQFRTSASNEMDRFLVEIKPTEQFRPKSSRYASGLLSRVEKIWRYWTNGRIIR